MTTTWIAIADSRGARIVERTERQGPLQEVERFTNLSGTGDVGGMQDDRSSRVSAQGDRVLLQAIESQVLPVEQENDRFARMLAGFLSQAKAQNRYDQLYLVAAPEFLGLLRGNLHEEVHRMVEEELPGDLAAYDARRIEHYLDCKFD